jgi:CTP:molybdopterin cytidylyltransferase MocA
VTQAGGVVAFLLAAGLSSRMGEPKPLLDWHGEPLVAFHVRQLQEAGADRVIVVTGHAADAVEAALRGHDALVVRNQDYASGRASSIRAAACALLAVPEIIVVLNVDQPRRASTIARLIEAHRSAAAMVTVPVFESKRGHPVLFRGDLVGEMREVSEATEGLRAVSRRHAADRVEVPVDTDEVLLDLNRAEDYRRAVEAWTR